MACCQHSCHDAEEVKKGKAFKVVLVGDGGVGKTALMKYMLTRQFEQRYVATLGVEVQPLQCLNISLNIWDCAGQEKFSGLKDGYYINADAVIVMFSLDNKLSAKSVPTWVRDVRRVIENKPVLLVGNKTDVERNSSIQLPLIEGLPYVETSVKTGEGCDRVFLTIHNLLVGETA